eukprot:TRINITY_DN16184_c0_g1_i1.p1 TRINITY_DN16184_c0_g1~~TRINITY_DN16184_c0_g1_i1.p1  ORF type:complete len:540 (-),score=26.48 TRINITY_DN16184_c0_g1_i1:777-2291(-)
MLSATGLSYGQANRIQLLTDWASYCTFGKTLIQHFDKLVQIVGSENAVTDQHELQPMNRDWMGKYEGQSKLALMPQSVKQVSEVLKYCNSKKLEIVPQGGNTGLVGGSVPLDQEIILSLRNMNQVREFDPESGVLSCDAGCVLESLDKYVEKRGFMIPLDLGAKGSCQIGGNIATNAGGLRVLRHGSLHGSILGLQVVLADGTILDMMNKLRKDNTGYDLKHIFIGSEGTLGVITGASILCPPRPSSVHLAYLAVPKYENVVQILMCAKQQLCEILSAFEFLDKGSLSMVMSYSQGVQDPLPNIDSDFYVLVETSGSSEQHDAEKMEQFISSILDSGLAQDGVLSENVRQMQQIWHIREGITEGLCKRGPVLKYDLSLPTSNLYDLVDLIRQKCIGFEEVKVVGYGHVGDGNLHLNVSMPEPTVEQQLTSSYDLKDQVKNHIEQFIYEWTGNKGGSISAEHGIGIMKAQYLQYSRSNYEIDYMKKIKQIFDPNGILNPGKIFRM